MAVNINENTLFSKTPTGDKDWFIEIAIDFYRVVDSGDKSENKYSKYKFVRLFFQNAEININWVY